MQTTSKTVVSSTDQLRSWMAINVKAVVCAKLEEARVELEKSPDFKDMAECEKQQSRTGVRDTIAATVDDQFYKVDSVYAKIMNDISDKRRGDERIKECKAVHLSAIREILHEWQVEGEARAKSRRVHPSNAGNRQNVMVGA